VEEISNKVSGLVGEIASASVEQAEGIEEIRKAFTVMDSVTQSNSATAEQASSATVVLNEQTEAMKTMAADLHDIVYGKGSRGSAVHLETVTPDSASGSKKERRHRRTALQLLEAK